MPGKVRHTHLPKVYDFKEGKLWPNDRPGLGVELDVSKLTLLGQYDTYRAGMLMNHRPDRVLHELVVAEDLSGASQRAPILSRRRRP